MDRYCTDVSTERNLAFAPSGMPDKSASRLCALNFSGSGRGPILNSNPDKALRDAIQRVVDIIMHERLAGLASDSCCNQLMDEHLTQTFHC